VSRGAAGAVDRGAAGTARVRLSGSGDGPWATLRMATGRGRRRTRRRTTAGCERAVAAGTLARGSGMSPSAAPAHPRSALCGPQRPENLKEKLIFLVDTQESMFEPIQVLRATAAARASPTPSPCPHARPQRPALQHRSHRQASSCCCCYVARPGSCTARPRAPLRPRCAPSRSCCSSRPGRAPKTSWGSSCTTRCVPNRTYTAPRCLPKPHTHSRTAHAPSQVRADSPQLMHCVSARSSGPTAAYLRSACRA
jgi:hypothetical protein